MAFIRRPDGREELSIGLLNLSTDTAARNVDETIHMLKKLNSKLEELDAFQILDRLFDFTMKFRDATPRISRFLPDLVKNSFSLPKVKSLLKYMGIIGSHLADLGEKKYRIKKNGSKYEITDKLLKNCITIITDIARIYHVLIDEYPLIHAKRFSVDNKKVFMNYNYPDLVKSGELVEEHFELVILRLFDLHIQIPSRKGLNNGRVNDLYKYHNEKIYTGIYCQKISRSEFEIRKKWSIFENNYGTDYLRVCYDDEICTTCMQPVSESGDNCAILDGCTHKYCVRCFQAQVCKAMVKLDELVCSQCRSPVKGWTTRNHFNAYLEKLNQLDGIHESTRDSEKDDSKAEEPKNMCPTSTAEKKEKSKKLNQVQKNKSDQESCSSYLESEDCFLGNIQSSTAESDFSVAYNIGRPQFQIPAIFINGEPYQSTLYETNSGCNNTTITKADTWSLWSFIKEIIVLFNCTSYEVIQ